MSEQDNRIRPLADVSPVWERECSTYPDLIRIPMSDGKIVTYRQDITQPHPAFKSLMESLEKLPVYPSDETPGYKAKHTKKPNLWDRIQKARQKG